jgi:hypothetical protein
VVVGRCEVKLFTNKKRDLIISFVSSDLGQEFKRRRKSPLCRFESNC